jgi:hypothetical protein
MKLLKHFNKKIVIVFTICTVFLVSLAIVLGSIDTREISLLKADLSESNKVSLDTTNLSKDSNLELRKIVYDGMTLKELGEKLERSMGSTIDGYGEFLASYCLEKGVDPYLALGIMLLETGCKWGCSSLTRNCYNVGGIKGKPSCGGGSYRRWDTMEDGIRSFVDNLAGYYAKGLDTPEKMNPRYAESNTWAMKVRNYMAQIRAK